MGRTKVRKSSVPKYVNLQAEIAKLRLGLERDLEEKLSEAKRQLPVSLLQMKLRDFLLLTELISFQEKRRTRRTSIASLLSTAKPIRAEDDGRRLTRSVARISMVNPVVVPVPATPKFNPALPETPAAYRRQAAAAAAAPAVPTFAPPVKAPLRITRSTIRVADPFIETDKKRAGEKNDPVVGVVSLELGNGETFDVDLTRSPRTLLSTLGSDALREVKQKMQTYASQLRSFFGKLQV